MEWESIADGWDGALWCSQGCQAMTGKDCRPLDLRLSMMIPKRLHDGQILTSTTIINFLYTIQTDIYIYISLLCLYMCVTW